MDIRYQKLPDRATAVIAVQVVLSRTSTPHSLQISFFTFVFAIVYTLANTSFSSPRSRADGVSIVFFEIYIFSPLATARRTSSSLTKSTAVIGTGFCTAFSGVIS